MLTVSLLIDIATRAILLSARNRNNGTTISRSEDYEKNAPR